ncbi:MAG: hypothetical protein HFH82_13340 [Lachnospiraceae bacterium]|nr:hypothetical protein [Lachnospiraceae bacterium]
MISGFAERFLKYALGARYGVVIFGQGIISMDADSYKQKELLLSPLATEGFAGG